MYIIIQPSASKKSLIFFELLKRQSNEKETGNGPFNKSFILLFHAPVGSSKNCCFTLFSLFPTKFSRETSRMFFSVKMKLPLSFLVKTFLCAISFLNHRFAFNHLNYLEPHFFLSLSFKTNIMTLILVF